MEKELHLQRDFLRGAELPSVYFGGGTPSLLSLRELEFLWKAIERNFSVAQGAEITLEANPDDLSEAFLHDLRAYTPVNRLSIGLQSFSDTDLAWMNRAHNAGEAVACLEMAAKAGFDDLTIDLIYGAPTTSDEQWARNLETAFQYNIPHLSCYALTVEPGTALAHFIHSGKSAAPEEEKAVRQFEYLMDCAEKHGYEHYEISNFALPGRYARHNSRYWQGHPYLGIGPAAHSFDGVRTRQWNIANNALYVKSLEHGDVPFEKEVLTDEQRYNERVLTELRTIWGLNLETLDENYAAYFSAKIDPFVHNGQVEKTENRYRLTRSGKLLADGIAADLFWPHVPE